MELRVMEQACDGCSTVRGAMNMKIVTVFMFMLACLCRPLLPVARPRSRRGRHSTQKKFEVRGVAVLKFWRGNTSVIPELSDACSQILLLKPSSATNERIFSLLMRFFGPMSGRSRTLVDVIMLTLMYRFNDPTRSIWESWPDQD